MKRIFCYFFLFSILFSCSEYQKILKSDDLNLKYKKAKSLYDNGKYEKAIPLLDDLSLVMRGTNKAEEIAYYYAYCHYAIGDNLMAAYLFNNYTRSFPKGKYHERCSFMVALCYYNEAPEYSLDSQNTHKAIYELQSFIDLYPISDSVQKCNILIDELREKLAKKEFEIAKQYYLIENYRSAIISLNNVLKDFPEIIYREEIHYLILDSSYLLAINSIDSKKRSRLKDSLDAYSMFIDNYPKSDYIEKVNKTHKKIINSLEILNKN